MRRVLVTGATGDLGRHLMGAFPRDLVLGWARRPPVSNAFEAMDLAGDPRRVIEGFRAFRPDLVVHAAAVTRISEAQAEPAYCRALNIGSTGLLARLCRDNEASLTLISTDMVFSGSTGHYREFDPVDPASLYGESKVEAERLGSEILGGRFQVIRAPLMHGGEGNFCDQVRASLAANRPMTLFEDEWRTPLHYGQAATIIAWLAGKRDLGVCHIAGPERLSRYEMGLVVGRRMGAPDELLQPLCSQLIPDFASRPKDLSMEASYAKSVLPERLVRLMNRPFTDFAD